jgi:bifunctional UDP-N-acetylglucosamine pyrophosphorylase/glucosamine-1-phosphate N-acetyltransferase
LDLTVIVLASGQPQGFRTLAGQPLVHFVVGAARALNPAEIVLLFERGAEAFAGELGPDVRCAALAEGVGPGNAVLQVAQAATDIGETVLVLSGSTPLIRSGTLCQMVENHRAGGAGVTLLAAPAEDAGSRTLCLDGGWLRASMPQLLDSVDDLGGLAAMARRMGQNVSFLPSADPLEVMEVDDLVKLARAEAEMRLRINERHMLAGVILVHPETTYIDAGVEIGAGTTIWPNTYLQGRTHIGQACTIGPGSLIRDSQIADRCKVEMSVVEAAIMEERSDIGPFGHLRKGAHLGPGVHMGNFGEVKNSYLGPGVAMGHMSYLGDATVGAGVNIGAGTITCNYDGKNKNRTIIGDGAFIGSDSMLVAPVEIGAGAKTGAGSVVTRDVPPGSVAYGVPARVKASPPREGAEDE